MDSDHTRNRNVREERFLKVKLSWKYKDKLIVDSVQILYMLGAGENVAFQHVQC